MFGSSVLELAIGLTFCYGTVALIVATVQEALAAAFRLRANTLLAGIKSMLNDPRFDALAQMIPLVKPLPLSRPKELDHCLGVLRMLLQIVPHHGVDGTR